MNEAIDALSIDSASMMNSADRKGELLEPSGFIGKLLPKFGRKNDDDNSSDDTQLVLFEILGKFFFWIITTGPPI